MRTHLVAGDDLAVRLFNLLEAGHEVPVHVVKHRGRSVPGRRRAPSRHPRSPPSGPCPNLSRASQPSHSTYQNFDRALTASSAQSFMRNTSGSGCVSVGTCRPTTWYWWYCAGRRHIIVGRQSRVSHVFGDHLHPALASRARATARTTANASHEFHSPIRDHHRHRASTSTPPRAPSRAPSRDRAETPNRSVAPSTSTRHHPASTRIPRASRRTRAHRIVIGRRRSHAPSTSP